MRALSLNSTKNYNLDIKSNRTLFRVGTRFRQFNDYVLLLHYKVIVLYIKIDVEISVHFYIKIKVDHITHSIYLSSLFICKYNVAKNGEKIKIEIIFWFFDLFFILSFDIAFLKELFKIDCNDTYYVRSRVPKDLKNSFGLWLCILAANLPYNDNLYSQQRTRVNARLKKLKDG